jgi:hypothetical protein
MVKNAKLFDQSENQLLNFNDVIVDICRSHTTIHKQFELISLPLELDNVKIIFHKICINYKSGHYLLIFR